MLRYLVLVTALICSALPAAAKCLGSQATANPPQGTVSPLLFGTNLLFNQARDSVRADARFMDSLTSIPVRTLRFPGGTVAENYFWKERKTARSDWFPQNYRAGPDDLDFDELASVAKCLGAQASIVLNLRYWVAKGDIESGIRQAEEWVQYTRSKSYGVKYWELGNEAYFERVQALSPMTGAQYGKHYAQFRRRLKAIDPSLELGMVMPNDIGATVAGDSGTWWDEAIKAAGGDIDYVVIHRYAVPRAGGLLRSGSGIGELLAAVKTKMQSSLGRTIPIHLTEWNIGSRSARNPNIVKHDTIGHALFVADALLDQAREGVRLAAYWPLFGPADQGLLDRSTYSLNAAGEVMQMLAPLVGWQVDDGGSAVAQGLQLSRFRQQQGALAIAAINWKTQPQPIDWTSIAGGCDATAVVMKPQAAGVSRRSLFDKAVKESADLTNGKMLVPGLSIAVIVSRKGATCTN